MFSRLKGVGTGIIVLLAWAVLDAVLQQFKVMWGNASPLCLRNLTWEAMAALSLTFAASVVAWLIGCLGGYVIGIAVGVGFLKEKTETPPRWSFVFLSGARLANWVYDAVYLIPLVLTLNLTLALMRNHYGADRPWVAVVMIAVAGLSLAGYNVYKSIYTSVVHAKSENDYLTESLLLTQHGNSLVRRVRKVISLRDCEVMSFCDSITRGFHLSIVAVMILESLVRSFYEWVIPQHAKYAEILGGTGQIILRAQSEYEYGLIAEVIWATLLLDLFLVGIIELFLHHRWRKYYKGKE